MSKFKEKLLGFAEKLRIFVEKNENIILLVALFYLIFKQVYYLVNIPKGIPPDESFHVALSGIYSRIVTFWPVPDVALVKFGVITFVPNLYHMVMGKLLVLNIFGLEDYIFLRVINLLVFLCGLLFFHLTLRLVFKNSLVRITAFVVVSNIMMFSIIGSSVTYDNFQMLFAFASVYFLVRLVQKLSLESVLNLQIALLMGVLSKFSFMPLAVGVLIVLVYLFFSSDKKYLREFRKEFVRRKVYYSLLVACIFGLLFYMAYIYLGNLLRYQTLLPSCVDLYTHAECYAKYALYRRNVDLSGDKGELMNVFEYGAFWLKRMLVGTVGFLGHKIIVKGGINLWVYVALGVTSVVLLVGRIKKFLLDKLYIILMFLALFYTFILFYFQNYRSYLQSGLLGAALQGRYIFPALGPLVILFVVPFFELELIKNKSVKNLIMIVFSVILSLVFVLEEFPYFYLKRYLLGIY